MDFALNNLQRLICHKTKPNQRFYCVWGELETKQNWNILTPTLMAMTAFLSSYPWLLNRGPGSSAFLGRGPHSRIFSPTDLRFWTPTAQSRVLKAPSAGCWFCLPHFSPTDLNLLSPGLYNNLTSTLLLASVTVSHSIQPIDSQVYILLFLDRMHLLFTQVHFLFWQLGRVGGQYTTLRGGRTTWNRDGHPCNIRRM